MSRRALVAVAAAPVAVAVAIGCHAIVGIGEVTLGNDATSGLDAGEASVLVEGGEAIVAPETGDEVEPPTDTPDPCGVTRGNAMVQVPTTGGSFCIDESEVDEGSFALFVGAPDKPTLPPECAAVDMSPPESWTHKGSAYPRTHVTWCHAWQYCAWAGKRLCGKTEGGGTVKPGEATEWSWACGQGGKSRYPYGANFVEGNCLHSLSDGGPGGGEKPAPVKTHPLCVGETDPYSRIFDMSANVAEWIDACRDEDFDGGVRQCVAAGGTYYDRELGTACDEQSERDFDERLPAIGFRCCK